MALSDQNSLRWPVRGALGGPSEQQPPLALVLRQPGGTFELAARLDVPAKLHQQVPAYTRQQMVSPERRIRTQPLDDFEPRGRTVCHGDRDRAVQLDDRRSRQARELFIETRYPDPVGALHRNRARMASRDRRLQ